MTFAGRGRGAATPVDSVNAFSLPRLAGFSFPGLSAVRSTISTGFDD